MNKFLLTILVILGSILFISYNPIFLILYCFQDTITITNKLDKTIKVKSVSVLHGSDEMQPSAIQCKFPTPIPMILFNSNLRIFNLKPNLTQKITMNLDDENYIALLIKYDNKIYINNIAISNEYARNINITKTNMTIAPSWITNVYYDKHVKLNPSYFQARLGAH